MDVDKYKAVVEIINSDIDDVAKISFLKNENISGRNVIELISDYDAWTGKRFEFLVQMES